MNINIQELSLDKLGINKLSNVFRNLTLEQLIENEILNKEGKMGMKGAMMVDTGKYTGRSPQDKYFVYEDSTSENIWWGPVNRQVSKEIYDKLKVETCGFDFEFDLLCKYAIRKHNIAEFPVQYFPRTFEQGKKIRASKDGLTILQTILKNFFIGK